MSIAEIPTDLFEPTPTVVITRPPTVSVQIDTLQQLDTVDVPQNDLKSIACRLEGKCNIPYNSSSSICSFTNWRPGYFLGKQC